MGMSLTTIIDQIQPTQKGHQHAVLYYDHRRRARHQRPAGEDTTGGGLQDLSGIFRHRSRTFAGEKRAGPYPAGSYAARHIRGRVAGQNKRAVSI